jgi:hypothetical protein
VASKGDQTALVLVRQEFEALRVLVWVQVLILLVEENRVRLRQVVESLENGIQGLGTFCAVEDQGLLGGFDELGLPRFQDARSARVLGLSGNQGISRELRSLGAV